MDEGKTADELETMIVTKLTNYPCSSAIRVNVLPSENGDELPNWEYTLAFTGPRKAGDTMARFVR